MRNSNPMFTGIFLALIVTGVALLILGVRASDSFSSDVSRFFTDSPTDRAIWMLIGGLAALIIGMVGLRGGRSRTT